MVGKVQGLSEPRTATGKLRPPSLGGQAVARPRLTTILDAWLVSDGTLSLLSAPAGYGKTYLLSQWADSLASR